MNRRPPPGRTNTRGSTGRRVRWPLLATIVVLGLLPALTGTLERSAPRVPAAAPAVMDLPEPLSDLPVPCTRSDPEARITALRAELRQDGRLTSALAHSCPRLLDGQDVVYVGEIVGDVLARDGGAWVQMNDDAYALELGPLGAHRERRGFSSGLAVWLPDGLHEDLGPPGRHARRGAVVLVEGMFLRADPLDGGGMSVRATTLTVLAEPFEVTEPLDRGLVASALVACLLAAGCGLWARRRARSRSH
jgi:hypothetical protein